MTRAKVIEVIAIVCCSFSVVLTAVNVTVVIMLWCGYFS